MTPTARLLVPALVGLGGCFGLDNDKGTVLPERALFTAGPPLIVKKTGQVFGIDVYQQIEGSRGGTATVTLAPSSPAVASFGFTVLANTGAGVVDDNVLRVVYPPTASLHHRIGGQCGDEAGTTDVVITSNLKPDQPVTVRVQCVAPTVPDAYAGLVYADGQRLIPDGDGWTTGTFRSPVARLQTLDRSTLAALEQAGPCYVYRDLALLGSASNATTLDLLTTTQHIGLGYAGRTWQATGAVSGPAYGTDRALTLTFDPDGAPRTYNLVGSAAPTDLAFTVDDQGLVDLGLTVPDADIVRYAAVGTSITGGTSGFWCDLPAERVRDADDRLVGPLFPPEVMPWFDEPDELLDLSEITVGTFARTGLQELVSDTLPVLTGDLLTFDPADVATAAAGGSYVLSGTEPKPDWFDGTTVTDTIDNDEDVGDDLRFDTDVVFDTWGPYTIVMLNFGGTDSYGSFCTDESLGYNLFATTECWQGTPIATFTLDGDIQRLNVDIGRTFELVGASSGQTVDGAPPVGADRVQSMAVGEQEYIQLEPLTILTVRASQGPSGMELRVTAEVARE